MGAIIGKGGTRIGEIRMMSGCNIHVERSDAESKYGMRRLTLKGTRQQITMAAYLVNQTISSFSTAEPKIPKEEGSTLALKYSLISISVTIKVEEQEQAEAQVGSFVDPMCE
jgi:predicted PilT family ATPase